jgi:hypothetical protein
VRGWQRLWVSDDDEDELFLILYEFDDASGADAFFHARPAGRPPRGARASSRSRPCPARSA